MQQKAERGLPTGKVPLGYRKEADGRIVPDGEAADNVRYAFILVDLYGYSVRRALEKVTGCGLRSRSGKPLGASALHAILTNQFYTGQVRYEGNVYPGGHEPLVSPGCFARVQQQLAGQTRRKETASSALGSTTPVTGGRFLAP